MRKLRQIEFNISENSFFVDKLTVIKIMSKNTT